MYLSKLVDNHCPTNMPQVKAVENRILSKSNTAKAEKLLGNICQEYPKYIKMHASEWKLTAVWWQLELGCSINLPIKGLCLPLSKMLGNGFNQRTYAGLDQPLIFSVYSSYIPRCTQLKLLPQNFADPWVPPQNTAIHFVSWLLLTEPFCQKGSVENIQRFNTGF